MAPAILRNKPMAIQFSARWTSSSAAFTPKSCRRTGTYADHEISLCPVDVVTRRQRLLHGNAYCLDNYLVDGILEEMRLRLNRTANRFVSYVETPESAPHGVLFIGYV